MFRSSELTVKILFTTCFLVFLITTCAECVRSQAPGPTLLTQENSQRAAALDSVTSVRDPLAVVAPNNFSNDRRARLVLVGINVDLMPGEGASAVTGGRRPQPHPGHGRVGLG